MEFSTTNVQISLTMALATHLRASGYDVLWQATQDVDAQTAGLPEAKATVTLVPEFPANPTYIVRLKVDNTGAETVVVPAFALRVLSSPQRIAIQGLGHRDYEWHRQVRVDGFAADEFQQRALLDLLHDWLNSEERKEFAVYDYDADPANPPLLGSLWIEVGGADFDPHYDEREQIRYYVYASAIIGYVE